MRTMFLKSLLNVLQIRNLMILKYTVFKCIIMYSLSLMHTHTISLSHTDSHTHMIAMDAMELPPTLRATSSPIGKTFPAMPSTPAQVSLSITLLSRLGFDGLSRFLRQNPMRKNIAEQCSQNICSILFISVLFCSCLFYSVLFSLKFTMTSIYLNDPQWISMASWKIHSTLTNPERDISNASHLCNLWIFMRSNCGCICLHELMSFLVNTDSSVG